MLVGWSSLWLDFVQGVCSLTLQGQVGHQYSRRDWAVVPEEEEQLWMDVWPGGQIDSKDICGSRPGLSAHLSLWQDLPQKGGESLLGSTMEKGGKGPGTAMPDKTIGWDQLSQCLEGFQTTRRSSSFSRGSWISQTPFTGPARVSVLYHVGPACSCARRCRTLCLLHLLPVGYTWWLDYATSYWLNSAFLTELSIEGRDEVLVL